MNTLMASSLAIPGGFSYNLSFFLENFCQIVFLRDSCQIFGRLEDFCQNFQYINQKSGTNLLEHIYHRFLIFFEKQVFKLAQAIGGIGVGAVQYDVPALPADRLGPCWPNPLGLERWLPGS